MHLKKWVLSITSAMTSGWSETFQSFSPWTVRMCLAKLNFPVILSHFGQRIFGCFGTFPVHFSRCLLSMYLLHLGQKVHIAWWDFILCLVWKDWRHVSHRNCKTDITMTFKNSKTLNSFYLLNKLTLNRTSKGITTVYWHACCKLLFNKYKFSAMNESSKH